MKYWKIFIGRGIMTAAIVVFCLPAILYGQAEIKTVTVLGVGTIKGDNVAAARRQAISSGLDGAVCRTVESEIPLETLLKNFAVINRLIHNQTDKFIQGYKVLTESRSGQLYSVLVQASVSTAFLEEQLLSAGLRLGRKALPKILFVVAEKSRSDLPPQYWWGQRRATIKGFAEKEAAQAMMQEGFTVIDPVAMAVSVHTASDLNKPDLTNSEAIELGRKLRADVVVIGRSVVHLISNIMGANIRSYQGMVTARAVRLDTGEEIAAFTQTAVAVGSDELAGARDALSKAGAQAGAELVAQILNAWQKEANRPSLVEVVIQGSSNLLYFERFRQALMELQGVRGLQIKEIRPDDARLVVDFEGNADKLAASLMLRAYGAFGIHITEIASNRLKIQLKPN